MSKPVIGIVAKHYNKDTQRLDTYIRDEVEQAVFDNGGVAIGILPPNEGKVHGSNDYHEQLTTEEKHNIYEQINLCDGIIVQGGGYIDDYECFIAKYCYDYDIPILGICAGNHNMVRAAGGSVGPIGNDKHHKMDDLYSHKIKINKDSILYKIIGKEEIMVNSRHYNQTINSGKMVPVAYSEDGIIEANEDSNKKFYISVQFHPESLYKTDDNMKKIFTSFIDICK